MSASLISRVSQSPVHQLALSVGGPESSMPASLISMSVSLISGVTQSPVCQLALSVE